MHQVIGYALLDFDDAYRLDALGLFNARYSHLATWNIASLLSDLAGHPVNLTAARKEFQALLLSCQPRAI